MPPRLIPYKNAKLLLLDSAPASTSELPQWTHIFVKHLHPRKPNLYACYRGDCLSCPFKSSDCYTTSNNLFRSVNSPLKRLS